MDSSSYDEDDVIKIQTQILLNQSQIQNKHCDVSKDTLGTVPARIHTSLFTNGECP